VNILRILQQVDRRFLYALLMLAVCIPFFFTGRIPVPISPETRALYTRIEELPPDSFVLIGMDWSASTRGENGAQAEALMRHLMKRRLRFAMIAFANPQGSTLGQELAERLQGEYGVTQGKDWCDFGYKTDQQNFLQAFVRNIPASVGTDERGLPLETLPVMKGIYSGKDISLFLEITGTNTYNVYIQFLQGPANVPMGVALTAVMSAEAYNYLDSKQIIGLVNGLKGAIEYEQLLPAFGKASHASNSSSLAHLLIITFIILGNIAMLLERRQRSRPGGMSSSQQPSSQNSSSQRGTQ